MATKELEKAPETIPSNPLDAKDMAKECRFWLESTDEGKAFLRTREPVVVYLIGEQLPGSPMSGSDAKPKVAVHHELGYWTTEAGAEKGKRNRPLVVIPVRLAE